MRRLSPMRIGDRHGFRVVASAVLVGSFLALGLQTLGSQAHAATQPLAWSIASTPNPSTSQPTFLEGVSCTSPTFCAAVGDGSNVHAAQTLVEKYNGSVWSINSSPNSSPLQFNFLHAVSCTSPHFCIAVGENEPGGTGLDQTLVETYNGSAWSITSSPNTSTSQLNRLGGISCASPTSCVAVGDYFNGTANQTLVETFDGSTWSIASSPNTSTSQSNVLTGVSCTSPTSCVAVGTSRNGTANQTLVETFDGSTWSVASSPNTSTSQLNVLNGVSCTSATSCVAVGDFFNGIANQTLVETYNGSSWSITASPSSSTSRQNDLNGVSCTSATTCVAVGAYSNGTANQTLVETFDGTAWSIGSSPNKSTSLENDLNAVSCTSTSSCVAAGAHFVNGVGQTLVETGSSPGLHVNNIVGIVGTSTGHGYWMVGSDGGVFAFGDASFVGSLPGLGVHVNNIVGIVGTSTGHGYWMVGSDGGVFAFGDASFVGSLPGLGVHVNNVVGIVGTSTGHGYWMVGSDGGVFAFGDASFVGSLPGLGVHVNNVVGIVGTSTGHGYWMVGSDGGVFAFGDASFVGSLPGLGVHVNNVVGIVGTSTGHGYWMVGSDGGVFAFGDASFVGSLPGLGVHVNNVVGIVGTSTGHGYWMVGKDGGVFAFGDASFVGSLPGLNT